MKDGKRGMVDWGQRKEEDGNGGEESETTRKQMLDVLYLAPSSLLIVLCCEERQGLRRMSSEKREGYQRFCSICRRAEKIVSPGGTSIYPCALDWARVEVFLGGSTSRRAGEGVLWRRRQGVDGLGGFAHIVNWEG
jgi:hypothetical protein